MPTILFVLGLVAVVIAVLGLAGIYWALLLAGALLLALAVLTEVGSRTAATKPEASK